MQALQAVIVEAPHDTPSVLRPHACVSENACAVQIPAWQLFCVQERVCVPDESQTVPNPPQGPKAPHTLPAPQARPPLAGTLMQSPVAASQVPRLHSSFMAEQSTAGKTHSCLLRSHVPGFEHRSGGVMQSGSAAQPAGLASMLTGASMTSAGASMMALSVPGAWHFRSGPQVVPGGQAPAGSQAISFLTLGP